ncbi:unnamed protein product [Orchesella dallaii]|uniref:Gustatory receptor n=1 Tax=Orchesella dallaii TaxID=48710 RepID=A0ABP1RFQ5_9HEXA
MLSNKTLSLIGAYYSFAYYANFSPFKWDSKSQTVAITSSFVKLVLWLLCVGVMWAKIIFMSIRLIQSYLYLNVSVEEFVIHFYYWVLYCFAGSQQLDTLLKLDVLPLVFNRFSSFNAIQKRIHLKHLGTGPIMKKDGVEPMIMNLFGIVATNSLVTIFLFLDKPRSPQFVYSVIGSHTKDGTTVGLIGWAIVEGLITTMSWTTILRWSCTSIGCMTSLNFWICELNTSRSTTHVSLPNSSLEGAEEGMKMWRNLQLLCQEFNIGMSNMTVGTKVAAFLSHLGTNYGSIRLFSSMTFYIWINCPMISICGLAVLISLFQRFSWINVESIESLASLQSKLLTKNDTPSKYLLKRIKSCPPLHVNGFKFYRFQRSTPVTFFKGLMDYTITVLLTF